MGIQKELFNKHSSIRDTVEGYSTDIWNDFYKRSKDGPLPKDTTLRLSRGKVDFRIEYRTAFRLEYRFKVQGKYLVLDEESLGLPYISYDEEISQSDFEAFVNETNKVLATYQGKEIRVKSGNHDYFDEDDRLWMSAFLSAIYLIEDENGETIFSNDMEFDALDDDGFGYWYNSWLYRIILLVYLFRLFIYCLAWKSEDSENEGAEEEETIESA